MRIKEQETRLTLQEHDDDDDDDDEDDNDEESWILSRTFSSPSTDCKTAFLWKQD